MLHSIFTGYMSQRDKNEIIYQDSEFTNIREYRQRMTIREYHQSIAHRVYHQRMSSEFNNQSISWQICEQYIW